MKHMITISSLRSKTIATAVQVTSILTMAVVIALGTVTPVSAANCTPPTNTGSATSTISVQSAANYVVWSRMNIPSSADNSFYISIDGGCAELVGGSSSLPVNTWKWVNYKDGATSSVFNVNLSAGAHTVKLIGNKPGVKVDKVLFLGNSCTPTSMTAAECIDTTAPTVQLTAPAGGATVSGQGVNLQATCSDASGVAWVTFTIDNSNTPFATDGSAPYTATWDSTTVPDGNHVIKAQCLDLAGNLSAVAQVTVTVNNSDSTPPSNPTNLVVTNNTVSQVDLSWSASTDNKGVAGYNVYRDGTRLATRSTSTTYVDRTVSDNTRYVYEVEAVDLTGNVSGRTSLTVTTPQKSDTTAPAAPTNVRAVAPSVTQVNVTWTKSPDADVSGYLVQRDGVVVGLVPATAASFSDTTVVANTTYKYVIVAVDTSGNSSQGSNEASVTTPTAPPTVDTTPPSVPGNVRGAAASETAVLLTWSASTDNAGGAGLAGYKIIRDGVQIATTNNVTTAFGDATVLPGTTHTYTIRSFDAATPNANTSADSAAVTVTTPQTAPNVLFSDIFNAGLSQWSTYGQGWSVPNVKDPYLSQTAPGLALAGVGRSTWSNYAVEASVRLNKVLGDDSSASYATVVGRGVNLGTFYSVILRGDGSLDLNAQQGGVPKILASKQLNTVMGQWYKVKLDMTGSKLTVYVDGVQQLTANDTSITAGSTGFQTVDMAADFDNVLVTTTEVSSSPKTITLNPTDDAWIEKAKGEANHGSDSKLLVDDSPVYNFLVKFNVTGTAGRTIKSAKLRLYNTNKSEHGGSIYRVANDNWKEGTVTWNNAPASGAQVGSFGNIPSTNAYYTVDLVGTITGDGVYTFRVSSGSHDGADYFSKEHSTNKPELVITAL